MTWLPSLMMITWCWSNEPEPLPPGQNKYIPRRERVENREGPIWRYMPESWKQGWNKLTTRPSGVLDRRQCTFRYQGHMPRKTKEANRSKNRTLARCMRLVTVTCMVAAAAAESTTFDSDAKQIAIDNCSSRCLTVSRKDFLPGTVRKCNVSVLGVGGRVQCNVKGTVSWTIEDDQGRSHDIVIPDTPMCPSLPHRLLSPQHWAQETERQGRKAVGSSRPSCSTNAAETTMTLSLIHT